MVKILFNETLNKLSNELDEAVVGDRVISASIEVYSCKRAGNEKKIAGDITSKSQEECEMRIQEQPETERIKKKRGGKGGEESKGGRKRSKSEDAADTTTATSPPVTMTELGDLSLRAIQNLHADLILTLNAKFPDYDFTSSTPSSFKAAGNVAAVIHAINSRLSASLCGGSPTTEVGANRFQQHKINPDSFLPELWEEAAKNIPFDDCQVFTYVPDVQGDPFSDDGVLWSFNYFFFSPSAKKILFFTCMAKRGDSFFLPDMSQDEMGWARADASYVESPNGYNESMNFSMED